MRRHRVTAGFSFVELLIVLVLMTIVAAMVIPDSNPNVVSQLSTAAQVLQSDLAYCQSLSVTHNSTFRIQFDVDTTNITWNIREPTQRSTLCQAPFTETIRMVRAARCVLAITPAPEQVCALCRFKPLRRNRPW